MKGDIFPELHIDLLDVEVLKADVSQVHELLDVIAVVGLKVYYLSQDLVAKVFEQSHFQRFGLNHHGLELMGRSLLRGKELFLPCQTIHILQEHYHHTLGL